MESVNGHSKGCESYNGGECSCGMIPGEIKYQKVKDNWKHAIGELILATNMSPAIQSAFIVSLSDIIEIHYRSELARLIAEIMTRKMENSMIHGYIGVSAIVTVEDIQAIVKAWGIEI